LVDQNSQPFLITGDTAWSMIAQLSQSEVDTYLTDRKNRGFNLVLVSLIEHKFALNAPANKAGVSPFTSTGADMFNTPNESYFAHADYVIDKAKQLGITVLLAPTYVGYNCGDEGWYAEIQNSTLTTMRNWGRYVGNRYKDRPNIIWMIGGDADPNACNLTTKLREVVAGIQEVDSVHLITAHNSPGQAAVDPWSDTDTWLNLNNIYTYSESYPPAITQYNNTPTRPFFLVETYYENEHNVSLLFLRMQAYWAVLSGGLAGQIFGACPMWHFNAPAGSSFCDSSTTWQNQLDSPGSQMLPYVGRLFASRDFYKLSPDQDHTVMTDGYQSGDTFAQTARATDGSSIIAYIPSGRMVTIDLTKISGTQARAWWFNPRTAVATLIDTYPTTGSQAFTTPAPNDWVLVIDDAARNFPAPGQ
jgi:hypothetical protein